MSEVKTILFPSGDHAGSESPNVLFVSLACSEPSAFITYISGFPSRLETKAIFPFIFSISLVVSSVVALVVSSWRVGVVSSVTSGAGQPDKIITIIRIIGIRNDNKILFFFISFSFQELKLISYIVVIITLFLLYYYLMNLITFKLKSIIFLHFRLTIIKNCS